MITVLWDEPPVRYLPGLTMRAAEALKPFVDRAMALERQGRLFEPTVPCPANTWVSASFSVAQWRELVEALRESQAVAEGIIQP